MVDMHFLNPNGHDKRLFFTSLVFTILSSILQMQVVREIGQQLPT